MIDTFPLLLSAGFISKPLPTPINPGVDEGSHDAIDFVALSQVATITGEAQIAGLDGWVLILRPRTSPVISLMLDGAVFATGIERFLRPPTFHEELTDKRATHVLVCYESPGACSRYAISFGLPPEECRQIK
jgi:hypothetical protein